MERFRQTRVADHSSTFRFGLGTLGVFTDRRRLAVAPVCHEPQITAPPRSVNETRNIALDLRKGDDQTGKNKTGTLGKKEVSRSYPKDSSVMDWQEALRGDKGKTSLDKHRQQALGRDKKKNEPIQPCESKEYRESQKDPSN